MKYNFNFTCEKVLISFRKTGTYGKHRLENIEHYY